jgi:ubiquinone/menaquinone biosynthesis C-methylase UbiE
MPIFRRNRHPDPIPQRTPPPPSGSRPASTAQEEDPDWRSYDRVAEIFARVHEPHTAMIATDLVRVTPVGPGARVLDVGTGTGSAARAALDATGPDGLVAGIDPSFEMLREARRADGPVYAAAVAIDLPFRDETFDVVLAQFVLSHFTSYKTALFDMLRVLRRGGRMGVSAWGAGDDEFMRAWTEMAERYVEHSVLVDAVHRGIPWHEYFQDPNRLKDALHDAGVRDIRLEKREYRFEYSARDYLDARASAVTGRFMREMLGEELWRTFDEQASSMFAERFPPRFNDFREVILASGHKG